MLWKPAPQEQEAVEEQPDFADGSRLFELSFYFDILRRRILVFVGIVILVLAIGAPLIALRPPIYLAEGKILVESPQIPSELVRPTVTASVTTERLQIIEQHVMTRDTMLALANRFNVFGNAAPCRPARRSR